MNRQEEIQRKGSAAGTPLFSGRPEMNLATDTRDLAYREIKGEIGPAQREVLRVIRTNASGISNSEIASVLHWPINRVTGRVYELRDKETPLVRDGGKRKCTVTGRVVTVWVPN